MPRALVMVRGTQLRRSEAVLPRRRVRSGWLYKLAVDIHTLAVDLDEHRAPTTLPDVPLNADAGKRQVGLGRRVQPAKYFGQ